MPKVFNIFIYSEPGRVVQSVTRLTADTCLTADPGVAIFERGD